MSPRLLTIAGRTPGWEDAFERGEPVFWVPEDVRDDLPDPGTYPTGWTEIGFTTEDSTAFHQE